MKRPRAQRPRSPQSVSRQTPRTRPAAATEMARLEHERNRLSRDIDTLDDRRRETQHRLQRIDERLKTLQGALDQMRVD